MDDATTDTAPPAAEVPRRVRRMLTVLGGTVAGTAIAWVISAAAASADAGCATTGLVVLPAVGLSDVVCVVERIAPVPPPGDLAGPVRLGNLVELGDLRDRGEQGDEAAGTSGIGGHGTGQAGSVSPAPTGPAGPVERGWSDRPGAPAPGGGAHEAPSLVRPVGELSAAALAEITGSVRHPGFTAGGALDRALADGMTRRGSPEPAPAAPVVHRPVSVPPTGTAGSPGVGADTSATATLSAPPTVPGPTRGRARQSTSTPGAGVPGSAPGVTPD